MRGDVDVREEKRKRASPLIQLTRWFLDFRNHCLPVGVPVRHLDFLAEPLSRDRSS